MRWGAGAAPEGVGEARERLIDAAEACFERYGVAKTTLEDVASAAHVSRGTVYRYFEGGRDEIVLAVVMREADRFEKMLAERMRRVRDISRMPVEGIIFTLKTVRTNPRLALLFAPEVAGQTGAFVGASSVVHARVRNFLAPLMDAGKKQGIVRKDLTADEAAEWMIRLVVSFVSVPDGRSDADERRFLDKFVRPAFLMPSARPKRPAEVVPLRPRPAVRGSRGQIP